MVLLSAECFGVEEEVTEELCCAACKTAPDLQWQSPVFPSGLWDWLWKSYLWTFVFTSAHSFHRVPVFSSDFLVAGRQT